MNRDYEGVVILGAPRSGTTLLRRLIDAHPLIVCPPETNLLSAASRFLEEANFAGGLSTGVVPGLGFSGFSEEDILTRLSSFLFQFWRDILAESGKEIWAEKTAVDVFHIDAVEKICGSRCRYVCIFRHALDVVCSMKDLAQKMDAYLPELHQYIAQSASISEASAQAWCDANRRLLSFADDHVESCIRLRYEDLVENPAREMNRVFQFLDIDEQEDKFFSDALVDRKLVGLGDWKTYEKNSVSNKQVGRHADMDAWTVERLAPIINPLLSKLGYEMVATGGHEDERRAKELGRMVATMNLMGSDEKNPNA